MPAMIDARCANCGKSIGWCGRAVDMPKCPRCGHEPDRAKLAADDAQMDEFRRLLALRPRDAGGDDLRKQRRAAGLSIGQVARLIELDVVTVSRWERGDERPTDEQAARLADIYQCG